MKRNTKRMLAAPLHVTVLMLVATSGLLPGAQADTLLETHGNLLASPDQPVPGPSGAYYQFFDSIVIADDGTVQFLAKMYSGDVSNNANSRALFSGTTAANLSMMIRGADPAPGLAGLSLTNSSGSQGIQTNSRISPDGRTLWSSYLSGPGVVSSNDSAIFGGYPESLALVAREGDAAPGTSGAVFSGDRLTSQTTAISRNGAVVFQTSLSGGDVVGTTNNAALYAGPTGALSLVYRKGDTVLPGPVTAGASGTGFNLLDSNGRVLYSLKLAGAGVSTSNDSSLWVYSPGSGSALLVREGQGAPGTAGATFNSSFDTWDPTVPPGGINASGQYLLNATLQGGDVVGGTNDLALYVGSMSGGLTLVARKGDPAPGTNAFFAAFVNNSTFINNAGTVLMTVGLTGGTSNADNNAAVYVATPTGIPASPYTLSLIMRAGDPAPGTAGAFFGPVFNQPAAFNDSGQAVFNRDLKGGDALFDLNSGGLYAWDPIKGLFLIARSGDQVEVAPGLFYTAATFGYQGSSNTDGGVLGLSRTGTLAMTVGWLEGGSSVVTLDMRCYPVYYPDADGDGSGDASSTSGVCSNASPPAGYVPNHTDCNDANPAVYKTWYRDADGDGYGNAAVSVCDDATPPAGYVVYGTDCNDTNPTIHPDRSDDSCDGVDQNCNGANDEGYQTHVSTCGFGPCVSTGIAQCNNGTVNDTCVPHSGNSSPETCPGNGVDDNCDGTVDNVAPPSGALALQGQKLANGTAHLTWNATAAATGYDLVTGSVQLLHSSGGSFSAATTQCLANDLPTTSFDAPAIPASGQGLWYLIRAGNCGGNTSYNSGFPSQVGTRDAGIAASGHGCP